MIHIEVFKLLQLNYQNEDGAWLLYLNTFVSGRKKVLNFSLIHARKDNKNLWPYVFNSARGKLSREVVSSSSHDVTNLEYLCQNWG